jgi:hypothetical protein
MTEKSIVRAVCHYLEDEYDDKSYLIYREPIHSTWRRPDVLFVEERRDRLHVIEAEPTCPRCFEPSHGFKQIQRLPANYRWIALPKSEFLVAEQEFRIESNRTGIGVMLVHGRDVEEYIQPLFLPGDRLHLYIEANDAWRLHCN